MSQSNKKILVSGCGFSWGGQERKTWVNIFQACGHTVKDVGGPAVSNRWIIDRAFKELLNNTYDTVILQLTSINKLDIEIDQRRYDELVKNDSLRNFTIDNIWPSSSSLEHPSKALYYEWLASPGLETQELFTKVILFDHWCKSHCIDLRVYQAYAVPWTPEQLTHLCTVISNLDLPLNDQYKQSDYYKNHDCTNQNMVPAIEYQAALALRIAQDIKSDRIVRFEKIQQQLEATQD